MTLDTTTTNAEQATLWNGPSGRAWVDADAFLTAMFEPFECWLADAAVARSARSVLDIGCGTGSTTFALADALGPAALCLGIDISEPLIAAATARARKQPSTARFLRADAQTHAFAPGEFDLLVSRFGVMFFDDDVRAFRNLRRAACDGAHLLVIAWRGLADNPFMTTAERAAAPLLSNLPERAPDGPGQFAFADPRRVQAILEQSGWGQIEITPLDLECRFPERALVPYLTRLGPLGKVLGEVGAAERERIVATARAAFDPYVHGAEVRFVAACWAIAARACEPAS